MREDFLHYIWRTGKFDMSGLKTTTGERVVLHHPGEYNTNAGPDFLNACVQIGEVLWAGHVEMHLNASEWKKHGHDRDEAYDNVILHVVMDEDEVIFRKGAGGRLPCLVLRPYITEAITGKYLKLLRSRAWIACASEFPKVNKSLRHLVMERMLVDRLERKAEAIAEILKRTQNDWEAAFYRFLARSMGGKINNDAMEMLAAATPLAMLARHKHDLFQIEALLFGQAGMLEEPMKDVYARQLRREYKALQNQYQLMPLPSKIWKYLRLRPANFPALRIAQLANLIFSSVHLFSKILEAGSVKDVLRLFDVEASEYWQTHSKLDKPSRKRPVRLGRQTIDGLVINGVVPFVFLYGKMRGIHTYEQKALQWLGQIPPESNHIIRGWTQLGEEPSTAYYSQALIQLKTQYCDRRRCMECSIGHTVLRG